MIMITGDTHGDFGRFKEKAVKKLKKGDCLIICGDFGFVWDGAPAENAILKKIGAMRFTTLFADGCHENYDLLKAYPSEEIFGGTAQHITGNLYHLQRGGMYEIDGKKLFVFGGGRSAEMQTRLDSKCYWQEEMPSPEEFSYGDKTLAENGNKADYIITHEPPESIKQFLGFETDLTNPLSTYLDKLRSEVTYTGWYFGKVHKNKFIPPKFHCLFDELEILP